MPQAALEAAALLAQRAGVQPLILGDSIEGEAAKVGRVKAEIARQVALQTSRRGPPCVVGLRAPRPSA
jgi:glycerate 2-kinase